MSFKGASMIQQVMLVAMGVALAQAQAPAAFEVASVRLNTLNDRIVTINVGPGPRFTARGYTLVLLMQRAYGVMDWNVTGGPDWIRVDRFDVAAKARVEGNLTEAQLQPRLQQLLAERFKLKLHRTTREMSGYALVVGKDGPKIKASNGEENRDSFRMNATGLSGQGVSMTDFARFVAGKLGLIAVDETGLPGIYDFKVDWKVEADQIGAGDDPREALRFAAMNALQNQLGLKLVPKKIGVETLVIESVEQPSEN